MPKNILIYFQNSHRNIFFESFVGGLIKRGHKVFFLTKCERGILHDQIEKLGATASSYNPNGRQVTRFVKHWWFLIRYCRKNKIDIVYSHLQLANLLALFAQYFISAKVLPCRHHVDAVLLTGNRPAIMIDKWINRLARKIIVVSNAVKKFMIEREAVKSSRIIVIPLGYNFDLYNKPNPEQVRKIRTEMNCQLLLIVISRMTPGKNHIIALESLNKLVKEGFDIKMILLDRGTEEQNLRNFIGQNGLEQRVLFTGFLTNTMDYLQAADMLVHPSISEASNQVVREAAVLEKPCIVCDGVGDFNEYILDRQNSFFVSKENMCEDISNIVREYYSKKNELKIIGARFKNDVLDRFGIEHIVDEYLRVA